MPITAALHSTPKHPKLNCNQQASQKLTISRFSAITPHTRTNDMNSTTDNHIPALEQLDLHQTIPQEK